MSSPDLEAAATAVDLAGQVVDGAIKHLASKGGVDANQVVAYDLAHGAAAVASARVAVEYGRRGPVEAGLACVFVADAVRELVARLVGRDREWGVDPVILAPAHEFISTYSSPSYLAELCGQAGPRHLDSEFEMVQDTFRRFADDKIKPVAEHVHRTNADIPEDIISGLGELGGFGLSVPEEYGGFATGGESDYMGMVVATEELSRGVARRRRLADHPARDPHPGAGQGRDRGAEARVAAEDRAAAS